MILEKTVFILGSGASCHLGYPLGSELWKKVADYLSPIKDFGKIPKGEAITEKERKKNKELLLKLGFLEKDTQEFCNSLYKYSPYNLDEFLENNQKYRELAKVAIAQVLIPYEDDRIIVSQQGWYQKLFEKMKTTVDKFHENNVTFISFNYDRSLEQYLFHKLKYSQVDKASECEGAINRLTFIHVYGKLGNLPWQGHEGRAYKKNYNLRPLRKSFFK